MSWSTISCQDGRHTSLAGSRRRSWRAASQRRGEAALGGSRPKQPDQLATGRTFKLIGAAYHPGFGGTVYADGHGVRLDFSIALPDQRIWIAIGFADQANQGGRGGNQESNVVLRRWSFAW